jgi:hypothetical protein
LPERQAKDAIFSAVRHKDNILMERKQVPDKKDRIVAYIDGYNLYFGMMEAEYAALKWLNIEKLINSICVRSRVSCSEVFHFPSNQQPG